MLWTPPQPQIERRPIPVPVLPPDGRRLILPGERGYEEALEASAVVRLPQGRVPRRHYPDRKLGSSGPPADFGSPAYSWWADEGLFSDDAHTSPQTTNGGAVANWRSRIDLTTYLPQTTSGHRPTLNTTAQNGHYGVSFDGSDDHLEGSFTLDTPFTEFYVVKVDITGNSGTPRIATSFSNQKCNLVITATSDLLEMDSLGGGPEWNAAAVPDDTTIIICCVHNGSGGGDTGTRIRVNADSADTTPNVVPSTGSTGGRILGALGDGSNACKMVLMAYVVYASALGSSDEQSERNVLNGWYAAF